MGAERVRQSRWLSVFVATLLVTSQLLAEPAHAQYTQNVCDGQGKYWCFQADWTPQGADLQIVNHRFHYGGIGVTANYPEGSAAWWQRWITQDWRLSGGSWTFLGGWAPGAQHTSKTMQYDNIYYQRQISGTAVVRMQNRYCDRLPGGGCSGYYWCSPYMDFHLNVVSSYSEGSLSCLGPQY